MKVTYPINLTNYVIYLRLTTSLNIFRIKPSKVERIIEQTVINNFPKRVRDDLNFYNLKKKIILDNNNKFDVII